jgi:hypothetical protein
LRPLFDAAIEHYGVVALNLKKVADRRSCITETFPFHGPEGSGSSLRSTLRFDQKPEHIKDESRRLAALECLPRRFGISASLQRAARSAEEDGLKTLEQIHRLL